MIKRESYMKKIRPFINSDLVKYLQVSDVAVKSVMLDLNKTRAVTTRSYSPTAYFL